MKSVRHGVFIYCLSAALILVFIGSRAIAAGNEQTIQITAKKFEFTPNAITVKKGIPVVLEFTTLDRMHGFDCPGLGIRTDIMPGKVNPLRFVPGKTGTFPFHCDNFCGTGHEGMRGTISVTE